MKLTIYHNGQYWIGILEEGEEGQLKAAKYLFGAEPKDNEVFEFILHHSTQILENTSSVNLHSNKPAKKVNPKRLAREVVKEMKQKGISTYAEEAMKQDLEAKKKKRQCITREQKILLKDKKRELAVQKKKEKHRGR